MPEPRRDHSLEEALDRYWDAMFAGEGDPSARGLDPELAAAVRRVHALDLVPPPHTAFTPTLWENLMHTTAAASPPPAFVHELTVPPPAWQPPLASRRSWPHPAWSRLAAAVLLAVLLAGSVVAVLYPLRSREQGPLPVVAPASTPAAQATIQTVFHWTLPEDLVPRASNLDFVLWNSVIEAGTVTPILAGDVSCCTGPQISHVMDGELSLSIDGPMRLFHGSGVGSSEPVAVDVPPGTAVTLHGGDTAVYAFNLTGEYANHGSAAVHLIGGGILAGSMRWTPAGFTLLDGNETYSATALPAGAIDATLTRAVLPPKTNVPPPPQGSRVLDVGAYGDASIAQQADGGLRNIGPREETIYVLTIGPASAASTP